MLAYRLFYMKRQTDLAANGALRYPNERNDFAGGRKGAEGEVCWYIENALKGTNGQKGGKEGVWVARGAEKPLFDMQCAYGSGAKAL